MLAFSVKRLISTLKFGYTCSPQAVTAFTTKPSGPPSKNRLSVFRSGRCEVSNKPCTMLFSAIWPKALNGSAPVSDGIKAAIRLAISVPRLKFLRGLRRTECSGKPGWKYTKRSGLPAAIQARWALSLSSLSPLGSIIITASLRKMAWVIIASKHRVFPAPVVPTIKVCPSVWPTGWYTSSSLGSTPWIQVEPIWLFFR